MENDLLDFWTEVNMNNLQKYYLHIEGMDLAGKTTIANIIAKKVKKIGLYIIIACQKTMLFNYLKKK